MTTIRVLNLEAAVAAVGLDLESFALTSRLTSHEAATLAGGASVRVTPATARRVASALGLAEGEITVPDAPDNDFAEAVIAPQADARSRRGEITPDAVEAALDEVCAEGAFTESERTLTVEVLSAVTLPSNLMRGELPAFLRPWLDAARACGTDGETPHRTVVERVKAEGPKTVSRVAAELLAKMAGARSPSSAPTPRPGAKSSSDAKPKKVA